MLPVLYLKYSSSLIIKVSFITLKNQILKQVVQKKPLSLDLLANQI